MPNRLAKEKSLYLRQHAHNPVDWWPWCSEAFEEAKRTNKLILVSIGYASCHWCHVMEKDCFEDEYIADLMNRNFVCIKVDREERPDLDQVYMESVQMITGRGGWPLNVFCLPDGRPFFGGTYFPLEDRGHGIIPWPQLLIRIIEHYKSRPEELLENAENIVKNLEISNTPIGVGEEDFKNEYLIEAAKAICKTHDDDWGGFGQAPKFPPSMILDFLLAVRYSESCERDSKLTSRIDEVIEKTLKGMAHGGIYDQIGGGFMRYSVDNFWLIPHFEKMLYDNGLLLDIYTKGWLRFRVPLFQSVIEETIDWLQREMLMKYGGFASSIDADSEGVEGKFYVWTPEEVIQILGKDDGKDFCEAYNITKDGNFEDSTTNPAWVYDDDAKRKELKPLREKLLKARSKRIGPTMDQKGLVSWNSLVIRGLANAGYYFNKPEWFKLAVETAEWIWSSMRRSDGKLMSVFYEDKGEILAYLDDCVFYAEACLEIAAKGDWFEVGLYNKYVERAKVLIEEVLKHFSDDGVGFYFISDEHEQLLNRKKIWLDNAIPCGNSVLVRIFSQLYGITGEPKYIEEIGKLRGAYAGLLKRAPNAVSNALTGFTEDAIGMVVLKVNDKEDLELIRDKLSERPYRRIFVYLIDNKDQRKKYQLCIGTTCFDPTDELEKVLKKI